MANNPSPNFATKDKFVLKVNLKIEICPQGEVLEH